LPSRSAAEAVPQPLGLDASAGAGRAWARPGVLGLGVVLGGLCVVRYDAEPRGFISAFTVAILVVLAATDLDERRIPNRIVLPATGVVLAAQLAFYSDRAGEWIVSALAAALFLFLPTVVKRGAVGMGDVKLALLMGAALGYAVLSALTVGFLAMLPVALYLLARQGAAARKKYIPLGPFLAFGAIVALLAGAAA
jgi:leader peptidase (prepilin peptidase)/N-methyltransferase